MFDSRAAHGDGGGASVGGLQRGVAHEEANTRTRLGTPHPGDDAFSAIGRGVPQDTRNFVRDPPSGTDFAFDMASMHPVAIATLHEDPNLRKMRFQLVPKQLRPHTHAQS